MKKIFISTLVLALFSQVSARENPFVRSDTYDLEVSRILQEQKQAKEIEKRQEEQYIRNFQKQIIKKDMKKPYVTPAVKPKVKSKVEKVYTQKEVKKLIKKAQIQSEIKAKNFIKKELKKAKMTKPQQVIFVKPRTDILEDEKVKTQSKKILPFVELEYDDDKIIIKTKYKVLKKFSMDKENKIIIDYKAVRNFYTKREDLSSKNFQKIAIGNHKKNKFFRVVLKVAKNPDNYKISYDKKNLIITYLQN